MKYLIIKKRISLKLIIVFKISLRIMCLDIFAEGISNHQKLGNFIRQRLRGDERNDQLNYSILVIEQITYSIVVIRNASFHA